MENEHNGENLVRCYEWLLRDLWCRLEEAESYNFFNNYGEDAQKKAVTHVKSSIEAVQKRLNGTMGTLYR